MLPVYKKLSGIVSIIPGIADEKSNNGAYEYAYIQPNSFYDNGEMQNYTFIKRDTLISDKQLVKSGDVLLKRLNSNYVYLTDKMDVPAFVSQNLFIIRPDSDDLLPEYLAYLMEQPDILNQSAQLSGSASTIKAISLKMLAEIEIPIVPIKRQKAIGALWKLNKRRQALITEYENETRKLMTAIYKSLTTNGGI